MKCKLQIDVIHYLIFEADLKSLFTTVSLSFTAMKVFHQVISERMKHKGSHL